MKLRFAHLADIHQDISQQEKIRRSEESIIKNLDGIDLILISGDFWNTPQEISNKSAANYGIKMIQRFSSICPVIMIKGNRQHDEYGGIEIFSQIKSQFPIQVCETVGSFAFYQKEIPHFSEYPFPAKPDLIIHCVSYPEKGYFLNNKEDIGIEQANEALNNEIAKIFSGFAAISGEFPTVPCITMFHGNIQGARISNGQMIISQDIIVPVKTLMLAGSDYYALGHIHEWQRVADNMYYSGSIYHKDFGEISPKKFIIGEFEGKNLTLKHIQIDSIPLSLHEAWIDANGNIIDKALDNQEGFDFEGAYLRLRITCTKEQRLLVTEEKIKEKYKGALQYKIEYIQIPQQVSRNEEIAKVKHLRDKIIIYGKAKNKEITERILQIADQVESETNID